jgi:putative membrane protein
VHPRDKSPGDEGGKSTDATNHPDYPDRSFRLASRQTGLSFQRTRLSADRTLMSVIRTSFALIGFGFTIYQFFRSLRDSSGAPVMPLHAARNFGFALVCLGVLMLIFGIVYHLQFMRELRRERRSMIEEHLIRGHLSYPVSLTLITALLLLLVGTVAIFSIVTSVGPFN